MKRIDAVDGILEIGGKEYRCKDSKYIALSLYFAPERRDSHPHLLVFEEDSGISAISLTRLFNANDSRCDQYHLDLVEDKK